MSNDAYATLGNLLLGAFLGTAGQLARVVVGLKKEYDAASEKNQTLKQRFSAQELWTSIGIAIVVGSVAGIITALKITSWNDPKVLLSVMAAGYSGTDFIEGFMKKQLPTS